MSARYAWQADAWRLARAALDRGAHALLIAGMRGVGKGDFALALAAAYLCLAPSEGGDACGTCDSCRWLNAGTHPDFALLERPTDDEEGERGPGAGASARLKPIGIDLVRGLASLLAVSAHHNAGKVVIIRPAEALNLAAANALLKSLEEPPPGVLFLLVSERPALLLPTVRSRCHVVGIDACDAAAAAAWLAQQGIQEPALELALSGGAPLEAAAIHSDPTWATRRDFLGALAGGGMDPIRVAEAYRDLAPTLALGWLQKWTYDLLLVHLCARARYHVDMQVDLGRVARRLDPVLASRLFRTLCGFQRHANHPLNARLFIENMLIEYSRAIGGGSAAA